MTLIALSESARLASHIGLIRAAADLLERAGIPGLAVCPAEDEIVIQVPQDLGDLAVRFAVVARLAALTGGSVAPEQRPGCTQGWLRAGGVFAGRPVRIYAPVTKEPTP